MGMGVYAGAKTKKPKKCTVRKKKPIKLTKKQCVAYYKSGPKKGKCKEFAPICKYQSPKLKKKKGGVVVEDVGSLWNPGMYSQMSPYEMTGRGMVGSARKPRKRRGGAKPWTEGQTMGCYEYCDNQGYGTNPWIVFLKNYGYTHGLKYNEVLKIPGIGQIYQNYKMSGQY